MAPPPTIQNPVQNSMPGSSTGSSRSIRPGGSRQRGGTGAKEKPADLSMRVRYQNTLPDLPFDPKFLSCPFVDLSRFIDYKQTSLEKNYKHELLTEPDLGVKIDLINPDTYAVKDLHEQVEIHETDTILLEDEQASQQDSKRLKLHSKVVPWMRKTEYISSEINRFGTQTERQETKVGYKIKKQLEERDQLYRSVQSQIEAIEKTFEDIQQPITSHHSKPNVHAVEEMPFLPDFDLWKYPFAQVLFDADPTPQDVTSGQAQEKMCQALLRGMMDEEGEQFVAYFLPTDETLAKRQNDRLGIPNEPDKPAETTEKPPAENEGEQAEQKEGDQTQEGETTEKPKTTYEYKMAREYNWTVKNKSAKGYEQENYFVILKNNQASYNELETRVRLNRRRAKEGHIVRTGNSRVIVTHRPETDVELAQQEHRIHQLFHPYDEEEEEEEEQQEQEEETTEQTGTGAEEQANESGEQSANEEEDEEKDETKEKDEQDRENESESGSDDSDAPSSKKKSPPKKETRKTEPSYKAPSPKRDTRSASSGGGGKYKSKETISSDEDSSDSD